MADTCNVKVITEALGAITADNMGMKDGITVSRAICAYNKTADDVLGQTILAKAKAMCGVADVTAAELAMAEYPSPWCLLYQAYKISQDDVYKNKIIELEESDVYMGVCFDMNYETMFGGKERYHELTVQFQKLAERPRRSDMEEAAYMLALIDTIEAISQPVYELYRSLVDIFRNELKSLAEGARHRAGLGDRQGVDGFYYGRCRLLENEEAEKILRCAVKKACRMKVILSEKYEAYICG